MKFSDVTKKIAGVQKSRVAEEDTRDEMRAKAFEQTDPQVAGRYLECADCEELKEEFRLLGVKIKDKTPDTS